jgi:HSP20 family protein
MARNPLTPLRSGLGGLGGSDPFLSLHREMNRLFDDVLRSTGVAQGGQDIAGSMIAPQINVSETASEIRVSAELPGVSEQDTDVSLDDDVLTIRREKKFERMDEKETFHFIERSYGTFQRALEGAVIRGSRPGAGDLRERRSHGHLAEDRTAGAVPPNSGAGWRTRTD